MQRLLVAGEHEAQLRWVPLGCAPQVQTCAEHTGLVMWRRGKCIVAISIGDIHGYDLVNRVMRAQRTEIVAAFRGNGRGGWKQGERWDEGLEHRQSPLVVKEHVRFVCSSGAFLIVRRAARNRHGFHQQCFLRTRFVTRQCLAITTDIVVCVQHCCVL